ncbi:uncharacterized protein LOC126410300 [Nymphaea colorata]|uniref:uncharacterized protein LOC116258819 n=1 Tax=Nymphaea colorata TaxID=210225 RepID=UPI00129D84F6|nr:uncharacterized protein LOC116258819 [Nymphaea colorata]XP_049935113.1 uncharacterized protein LOC126410300 [Nymphaea colorata]
MGAQNPPGGFDESAIVTAPVATTTVVVPAVVADAIVSNAASAVVVRAIGVTDSVADGGGDDCGGDGDCGGGDDCGGTGGGDDCGGAVGGVGGDGGAEDEESGAERGGVHGSPRETPFNASVFLL